MHFTFSNKILLQRICVRELLGHPVDYYTAWSDEDRFSIVSGILKNGEETTTDGSLKSNAMNNDQIDVYSSIIVKLHSQLL